MLVSYGRKSDTTVTADVVSVVRESVVDYSLWPSTTYDMDGLFSDLGNAG
jgi:hypothetical protein